jgi:hypothetical protein
MKHDIVMKYITCPYMHIHKILFLFLSFFLNNDRFDPTVGCEILERVNIGYDANAAAYFSSLESGTAMSRCECMASNSVKYTPRSENNPPSNSSGVPTSNAQLSQYSDLRASVIAAVEMEKGVRAIDMAPLPTFIYGEGTLGNPIPINLQTAMHGMQESSSHSNNNSNSNNSSSSSNHNNSNSASSSHSNSSSTSSSNRPTQPAPQHKAYGQHFKAPKP